MPIYNPDSRRSGIRIVILLSSFLTAAVLLAGIVKSAATEETRVSQATPTSVFLPPKQTGRRLPAARDRLYVSLDTRHTRSIAWGDINGDGLLDLAVGNGLAQATSSTFDESDYDQANQIYLNLGGGTFKEENIGPSTAEHQRDTRSVAWGDWDGDGDLDLAVGNGGGDNGPQKNQVYENVRGKLNYDMEKSTGWESAEAAETSRVAWGDWDGDGDLDLAVGNEDSANQVYENISGTLAISLTEGIGWVAPESLTTADLAWGDWDGDGDLDLAMGNYGQADRVYENISDTLRLDPEDGIGWQAPEPPPTDTLSHLTQSVAWGDWDADGDLDLATGGGSRSNERGSFIKVYENISGTLQLDPESGLGWELVATTGIDVWAKPASLAWADWDNDGDLDLVLGNNRGNGVGYRNQVYANMGGVLQFNPAQGIGWQSPIRASLNEETTFAVSLGDADGDGDIDLAVGNGGLDNGGQTNYIFRNDFPVIAFDAQLWESAESLNSSSIAWGDWDGDNDLDLAVGNVAEPNQVYENVDGFLTLDPANNIGWVAPMTDTAVTTAIAWGDWDGDGDLDLAVGNEGAPDRVYENDTHRLLMDPANNWGWQTAISDTGMTRSLAWGDWDQDGDLDLAIGKKLEPAQVYENVVESGGGLQLDPANGLGWMSPISITAESVAWGDWDDDDDLDLALGTRVFENADGTLTLDEDRGLGWDGRVPARSVAWGDMDGDGDLELAVSTGIRVRVYQNTGETLVFAPRAGQGWQYFQTVHATGVAWGDIDGDGDLDLATSNASPRGGYEPNLIFENVNNMLSEDPVWETADGREATGVLMQSQDLAWGDADNDGDLDLAFANGCSSSDCEVLGLPNQVYFNTLQRRTAMLPTFAVPLISVIDPDSKAGANFYASPDIASSNVISIPYTLVDPHSAPVGRIEVFYSLDGGDNWQLAEPTEDTQTTNLAASPSGTQQVYGWDSFDSGFFGRSDNVAIRFVVYKTPDAFSTLEADSYRYFNGVANSFQRPTVTAATFPFRVQSTQVRVVDEAGNPVKDAVVFRLPAGQVDGALYMPDPTRPRLTDENGLLPGGGKLELGDRLVALRPAADLPTDFTTKARLFHTSAAVTEDGLDMFEFQAPGQVELVISDDNPLLLFDLDAALEWNAATDPTFMSDLSDSFQRASEILYDVSNGQIALGRINIFQGKELWPQADIVIMANNSMRPSAAIGGIAARPVSETVLVGPTETKVISNAYGGGQIRMGTVWDPFGENTAELGEEWWRALAHELAHYLLFLPDNYLGFTEEGVLGKINCQGSFMTSTYDPAFSEFLTEEEWTGICRDSLAEVTTGRADWDTVTTFYNNLNEPAEDDTPFEGPGIMPLPLTWLNFWPSQETRPPLRARNFDLRDEDNERLRLPAAQAYLFQKQDTDDPTDDMIVNLGNPTGGGDRLKVRGAYEGDRLCLIDPNTASSDGTTTGFIGCNPDLQATDVSIQLAPMDQNWQPQIQIQPVTSRTLEISVTQPVDDRDADALMVQIFPLHYWSVPNFSDLSPTATLQTTGDVHTATVTMALPAYEVAARVWATSTPLRETVSLFNLNPPWPQPGGSSLEAIGGPNSAGIGGPNSAGIGGPNSAGIGGPNSAGIGGPNSAGIGGPNSAGIGGPNSAGIGGPNSAGIGGPNAAGIGGPNAAGIGGPNSAGIGGPNSAGIGGPNSAGIGGPNSAGIGGPNSAGIGGPNASGIGGANAPILSADAQVVVYSKRGFFEDNGVETLQTLGSVPHLDLQPWLEPVGQAYHVKLTPDVTDERIIALNYLQRDVPEGYEHTLKVYFLPDGKAEWERLDTSPFTENLVVADLQEGSGAYAVMSTIEMPALLPGWNQFVYPLPDPRPISDVLRSISGTYSIVFKGGRPESVPTSLPTTNVDQFEFGHAYWVWVHDDKPAIPFLKPPRRSPDGYVPGS